MARYIQRLRQAQGLAPRSKGKGNPLVSMVIAPRQRPLTPRQAAFLVLRRPEKRDAHDEQRLARLQAQPGELAEAIALAQDFATLVRERQPEPLDAWLKRAAESTLSPFRRFAKRLWTDYAAVRAALALPWSNGPVEGHINRLKMLKRQMFGRAGMDLLSRRFLLAA